MVMGNNVVDQSGFRSNFLEVSVRSLSGDTPRNREGLPFRRQTLRGVASRATRLLGETRSATPRLSEAQYVEDAIVQAPGDGIPWWSFGTRRHRPKGRLDAWPRVAMACPLGPSFRPILRWIDPLWPRDVVQFLLIDPGYKRAVARHLAGIRTTHRIVDAPVM